MYLEKTTDGIFLVHTDNSQGTSKFYNLKNQFKITGNQFTPMPMRRLVIDILHAIRVENIVPEDLTFTNTVGGGIGDDG